MKKLYLFNDTSASRHAGCRAVMRSLHHHLDDFEIVAAHKVGQKNLNPAALEACNIVLVNGEGTIHHDSPRADFLLEALRQAQSLGKKTLLVNALFQQYENRFPGVLERLDFFSVREPRSAEIARRFGGYPEVRLDSAADPLFIGDGKGARLAELAGIVKGGTHPSSPFARVFDAIDAPEFTLANGSLEDVVTTLRDVELYLTGQHHGVYAAGLAGIPFVASPSNSHKIESLIEWSGLPIPICRDASEVPAAMEAARSNPAMYRDFKRFLESGNVFTAKDIEPLA